MYRFQSTLGLFSLIFALGFAFFLAPQSGYAFASTKTDPIVAIAADVTQQEHCMITFHINIGTPEASSTSQNCPLGSIIRSKYVSLSFARAHHELYIVLPLGQVSSSVQHQFNDSITQLMEKKGQELRQSSPKLVHPNTGCGQQSSAGGTWGYGIFGYNTSYYSQVDYFRTSDCNFVTIQQASITVYGDGAGAWNYDKYQGHTYGVPGCPWLNGGGSYYHHSINQQADPNYYYETWLDASQCYGNQAYTNLGPLT